MEFEYYTDDEDFNELVNRVVHPRRPKNFRQRCNHFEKWNDTEFLQRFRLSKETVHHLIEYLPLELRPAAMRNHALNLEDKVLATLRYLATGSILQVIGDFSGFDKGTASRAIHQCLIAIAQLGSHFINMAQTEEEIAEVRQGFYNISRFPQCIGALDCTHIKIQSPGGDDAEIYRNRKGYFSFNVQAICDSKLMIRDIVCRWPGSSADATIFSNSRVRRDMEFQRYGRDSLLLGDAGYPIKNYLMTPLKDPRTPAEALYNEAQIRTRNPIERCFGVWKRRFPVLALGIKLHVDKVEEIVIASAVLHNIAILMKDEIPQINEQIEIAIQLGNVNEVGPHVRIAENDLTRYTLIHQYFQDLL